MLLKDAKNRGHRPIPIGFTNYLTALLICAGTAAQAGSFEFTKLTFTLGFTNGVSYSIGFWLLTLGLRISGIVVTMAVERLSVLTPIVFAILFWDEIPNHWQTAGILLACCALPILGTKDNSIQKREGKLDSVKSGLNPPSTGSLPSPDYRGRVRGGLGFFVVAAIFINASGAHLAMKAFNEMCPVDQKPMYLLFLFGTTAIAYTGTCIYRKTLPTRWEAFYGILMGICNVGGSGTFLIALDRVNALIAFPVASSGGMLFAALVGVLFLGERLNRKSTIGVVVTILALILVNLKGA